MPPRPAPTPSLQRQLCLALAALAVVFKVLVPAGFMVQAPPPGALAFPLVICTGQGAVRVDAAEAGHLRGKTAPNGKASHEAPCLFAGHAAAAAPPDLLGTGGIEFARYAAPAPSRPRFDLSPGRGLAAPPLPARGPPLLMT